MKSVTALGVLLIGVSIDLRSCRYNSDGSLDTSLNNNAKCRTGATTFVRLFICPRSAADKQSDPAIKGAVMGHEFVSPVRWSDASTLVLERHDYYERLMPPSGSVHGFDRLYEITVSLKNDGTADTALKLLDDR